MKRTTGFIVALVVMAAGAMGAFAQGSSEAKDYKFIFGATKVADQTTVGSVEVAVPDSVKAYFAANGQDTTVFDKAIVDLTKTQKDNIDIFVAVTTANTHKADLDALIEPVLQAALVRGKVEVATLRIGLHVWSMSIVGPEDED